MLRMLLSVMIVLLTACAYGPKSVHPGQTKAQVRAAWGEPDTVGEMGLGPEVWIYNRGSPDCEEYSLVFDRKNRLQKIQHLGDC